MKWIYERWEVVWDATAFTESSTDTTLYPYTINIRTLEVENRSPSVGEACISESTYVSNYNSGVRVAAFIYQGKWEGTHRYMWSRYNRNELSALRIKGDRMPDIALEEGAVPDNGIHTDGIWYVKIKPAFPTMRILRDGQWAEVETGFVLKDGAWKPIEEIYKLQDGQWVQA